MTDNTSENYFTKKHANLTLIATFCGYFAWVIFFVQILYVWARYTQFKSDAIMAGEIFDFMKILSSNPIYAASIIIDMLSIFMRGIVYALVLKGISLGLKMIVDTNLNLIEKASGANNE